MNPEKPKSTDPPETAPNPEIDEFFQRLPGNLHWPPPTEAAIAAAVEAIQKMAGTELGTAQRPQASNTAELDEATRICTGCGTVLESAIRFCGNCGLPAGGMDPTSDENPVSREPGSSSGEAWPQPGAAQHHYHHHYHHFIGTAGTPAAGRQELGMPQGRASLGAAPGSRAELTARQVAHDWAQACNTRHLDDVVELYSSDATLIRPNVLPIRGAAAIREFLFAALEAGLGDVEMDTLRTEIFGEIAIDVGRCKMLVPVAMGKRREERGKYLLVMARQPAGHWKIVADCWSTDLSVGGAPASEVARKATDPAAKKAR